MATFFRTAAHSGSLVRYLEPFAHTVGVMQTPDALHRVAFECVEDLAADNVVYAEVRFAPELHIDGGLSLDAVVDAVLDGFAAGEKAAASAGRAIVVALPGDRDAARRPVPEIAELAVRFRDRGVVGFDIAGAEAGYPPRPAPRRLRIHAKQQRALHDSRRRGLRATVHPRGHRVLRGGPAGPRCAHRR